MQSMLRSLTALTLLLFAPAVPALAMDQSATEETNCLMACDANQQNCLATGHWAAGKHGLSATKANREVLKSRSSHASANFSQVNRSVAPKERLRQQP
jgi:hypothetical protein